MATSTVPMGTGALQDVQLTLNTLRLINVRNADKAIYFTLVVPLS